MLVRLKSFALDGIEGYPVDIEVDTQRAIPSFDIVGLPSTAVKEARNRVRSAVTNSNFEFMPKRVTVNMAPADVKKNGSQFDFPIALGYLASTEQISPERFGEFVVLGELSLDGALRPVSGIMPILISGFQAGFRKFILPEGNAKEASFLTGIEVFAVKNLSDACSFLGGLIRIPPVRHSIYVPNSAANKYGVDMRDVRGQTAARRAIEIAVAGGHNILLCGSPGAGKTLLAKCVPTIMPDMTFEEAVETTKIHSVSGLIDGERGMLSERPFRSPHHTASLFSLTGGGTNSLPGEVSLAHNGVLFLDEMPEYSKKTLETLRQPLEDRVITVARVSRTVEYPANFMLIGSMNPCPCGYKGSRKKKCECTPLDIKRYRDKISGPLLDRIDIYVEVDGVEYDELRARDKAGEDSATVKARVEKARAIQHSRFKGEGIWTNAQMNNSQMERFCKLDQRCEKLLAEAYRSYGLTARGANRIIKTARTIADLAGSQDITLNALAEAVQYRTKELRE